MPKIQDAFKSIKINLPSYEGSEIEIRTNVSMEDVVQSEKGKTPVDQTLILAERMILDWNFEDEKGEKVPVNQENIKMLPAIDLQFLFEAIAPYVQKKTLSKNTK